MTYDVTIGGEEVEGLIDVKLSGQDESRLGTAEIEATNTAENRSYSYGDNVHVEQNGDRVFTGKLTGKPSAGTRNLKINLKAKDNREKLHNVEVHRPFYDMDSGRAIREAIEKETDPRDPVTIFDGDDTNGFNTDVPTFELADISSEDLNERGRDLLFLYWREDNQGKYSLRFDGVPTNAADDGNLLWFETRYLFSNQGGFFSGEVELRDAYGNSYVWDLDIPERPEFEEVRMKAEDATTEGAELTTNSTLEYRIDISGSLPEPRAAVIDYARARPFGLKDRDEIDLDLSGVEDTNRDIIRRFDESILEMIEKLAVEDGATSYMGGSDRLVYEPAGDSSAPDSITYDSTRVTDVDVDRDSADIVNRLTAQGAGNLQKEYRATSSIDFYGVHDDTISDKDIQTEAELDEWATGHLNENAWEDTAATFTVVDEEFRAARVGQSILVEWEPDDIFGEFIISSVEFDGAGRIDIGITGHGGI